MEKRGATGGVRDYYRENNYGRDYGGGGGGGGQVASSRPEEITQSLPVPEHKMGWIVGKRGSYITQLCCKSGAQITISESTSREYGILWKYVQITGSGRAVDRAKKLLHIRLDRLEPRAGGNGGQPLGSNGGDNSDENQSMEKEGGYEGSGGGGVGGSGGATVEGSISTTVVEK